MITQGWAMGIWFPEVARRSEFGLLQRAVPYRRLLAGPASGLHVLMIEDDAAIAEMYRIQFEHDGFRVSIATTGEVAVATLTDGAPDLVLLDLLLPDRSGFEVLASLNERLPTHPPVVILSNYGEPSMIDRGRSLGAIEYLVKSRVTPAEISRQIPTWVEQGRGGGQPES
ncbi:MAG TPA: response regulator [Candidatus Dormibacteraeota bacterium]|nr:response regulator [Candidatus Dormibacteraeota bacterium]